MRITDFHADYTDELVRMWRASFEHGVGVKDPHPIEEQVAAFRSKILPNYAVHVAWLGEEMAGFLASNTQTIRELNVHVKHLRQGIGSRLLTLAKDRSCGSLWLHTLARNGNARQFYEKHGFIAVAHGFAEFWQLDDVKYEWVRRP